MLEVEMIAVIEEATVEVEVETGVAEVETGVVIVVIEEEEDEVAEEVIVIVEIEGEADVEEDVVVVIVEEEDVGDEVEEVEGIRTLPWILLPFPLSRLLLDHWIGLGCIGIHWNTLDWIGIYKVSYYYAVMI